MKCSSSYNLRETRWKCGIIVYVPVKTKNIQILKHREGRENEKVRNTASPMEKLLLKSFVEKPETGLSWESSHGGDKPQISSLK